MRGILAKNSWATWLLVVSLAFNVGFIVTFLFREYGHHADRQEHGEHSGMRSLHKELGLTESQQEHMEQAKKELLGNIEVSRNELAIQRQVLAELLAQPQPDPEAISAQLDRISSLQRQVQHEVVEHLLEERELLHGEQQELFNEIIRRRICPHGGHGLVQALCV